MPPAADRILSNSSATSSGRRLISRITSPFASKSRAFAEFSVKADDEHRQYSPGDIVPGVVELRVVKPTRITHIVVSLHGFVQVYKNPGSPPSDGFRASNTQVGSGRGSRSGEYFGNGFASLFEDEVVLCGDGRLGEGIYKFAFNLEFPDRDLPSSISFERGTISYVITATITRPVAITPVIQCDKEVKFVERVDISQIYPPKSRTITLEPLSRKIRTRNQARKLVESDRKGRSLDSEEPVSNRRPSEASSSPSVRADLDGHQSPSPSELSYESGSHGPMSQEFNVYPGRQSDGSQFTTSQVNLPSKKITAMIELLTGGCLRGDRVPVRVLVNHTKMVKSVYGVIITLYRQARVDMHPSIPLGPTEKGKEGKYEDIYPKSLTGLGGLSLSGAGSSHVFRKDLSQVMLPLMVDPSTLTAEINGKVHVPEDAFPTISTVPGAMISFRYYVEVVVDIQGKLSSSNRNMTNLGGLTSTIDSALGAPRLDDDRLNSGFSGSTIIDTATLRRDKGVVSSTFEIIVGTKDNSERRKGKRKVEIAVERESNPQEGQRFPPQPESAASRYQGASQASDWQQPGPAFGHSPNNDPWYHQQTSWHNFQQRNGDPGSTAFAQAPSYYPARPVPMPPIEDESQLSEKERMRRAEARLLPSQAPGFEDTDEYNAATAPYLPDEQDVGDGLLVPDESSVSMLLTPPTPRPSTFEDSQIPEYSPGPSSQLPSAAAATDNKQELQRREYVANASAPLPPPPLLSSAHDEEGESSASWQNSQGHVDLGLSVPTLEESEELYDVADDSHADASGSSGLPRYER